METEEQKEYKLLVERLRKEKLKTEWLEQVVVSQAIEIAKLKEK